MRSVKPLRAHSRFEMLAFKNDVSHWKQKNEMVGVSLRTVSLLPSVFGYFLALSVPITDRT